MNLKRIAFFFLISFPLFAADAPKWVNSPLDFCGDSKLCAVGEASGRMTAEAEARKAIAKIFETRISSSQTTTTTSESKREEDVVSGSVEEDYQSQIKEITEETLEGVEVTEYYDDGEGVFALAVLNKAKAAKNLREKMDQLDEDIYSLYKLNRRSSINKALKLFAVRNNLNKKHHFLASSFHAAKVTKSQLLKAKREKAANRVVVLLEVDEISDSNELRNVIIEELLNNDLKVVTAATLKHNFVVTVTLSGEKQHMNVEGFEKYKFLLSLISKDSEKNKIGNINYSVVKTGRNLTQAYSNALVDVKNYIKENVSELNID